MDITSLDRITGLSRYGAKQATVADSSRNESFENMFQAAVNMINDTNKYTNAAQEAQTSYALGLTDSTSDLQVAQMKATLALQYTVAIRNGVMDAYKEIMNLQF
jgi:flagellar hook-basal body complex protein FliE